MERNVERGIARDRCPAEGDDQLSGRSLGRFEREVDRASAFLQAAVGDLPQRYPEHTIGGAALEDLRRLRPHVEGALTALAEIERRRGLTQKELSRRRAFKILLEGAKEG